MRHNYPGRFHYVDLFSGSGVGEVEDNKNDRIFGSPLIVTKRDFPEFVFCDENRSYTDALKARIDSLSVPGLNYNVYNGDCNSTIEGILPSIEGEKQHSLIFIDPYGMELEWKTFERILNLNADIVFNFMSKSIARGITQKGKVTEASRNFFKNPRVLEEINGSFMPEDPLGDRLLSQYVQDIKETRAQNDSIKKSPRKTIVESVRIKKEDRTFYYDLLFIARETKGGCPWLQTILDAKKEIEKLDSGKVQRVLDVLQGRQSKLTFHQPNLAAKDLESFFRNV
jgi:three-Cys-motif partner protein